MTDYLCLTLLAAAGESEPAFKTRLTAFWTHLLRTQKTAYDAVYAEARQFGTTAGRVSRAYMVQADALDAVLAALHAAGIETAEVNRDDTYSKYEASGSEWFQIPH